jgi:spore germination protein GerM
MTSPFHPDDDPLAARLRDALHTEADMVHPSDDGLQQIRSGIEESRRPWWRHPAAVAVAAAAVLGVAVGGLAVTLNGDDEQGTVATNPTTEPETTPEATPSTTPTPSPSLPGGEEVYVYYLQNDLDQVRLYREQHVVALADGEAAAAAAVRALFEQEPVDPDYVSNWPVGAKVRDYEVSGGTATIDVSDAPAGCECVEEQAMQQVVYTITANDPAVEAVRMLVKGETPKTKGGADWSEPVPRAPMVDVQGLIWLLTPTQDATVSSPVDITGYGTAFEGTVSWEVRRDGSDEVVADGFTQAGANGEFDEFSDAVDLEPGTYEIRVFESSAEDGSPLHPDSKVFTVE